MKYIKIIDYLKKRAPKYAISAADLEKAR